MGLVKVKHTPNALLYPLLMHQANLVLS